MFNEEECMFKSINDKLVYYLTFKQNVQRLDDKTVFDWLTVVLDDLVLLLYALSNIERDLSYEYLSDKEKVKKILLIISREFKSED